MQIFQSELTNLKCTRLESGSDGIYPDVNSEEPILITSQEDVGTKFKIVLTDNGDSWNPAAAGRLSLWYSGSSGDGNYTQINGRSAFQVSENTVEIEIIAQMILCNGAGVLWLIQTEGDGSRKTLCKLPYITLPGPNMDSVEAQQYFTAFTEMIKAAETFTTDPTLKVSGKAADAAAVGTKLNQIDEDVAAVENGLKSVFNGGLTGITTYPDWSGIYRCTGVKVFNNLPAASAYGILVIFRASYAAHVYFDMNGNMFWGYTGDRFGEPDVWHQVSFT